MHMRTIRRLAGVALMIGAVQAVAFGTQHSGTVVETMDSGGYTYMKIEDGGATYWTAAPATKVAVGDRVSFIEQMRMSGFTSKTLHRTFEELMFVSEVSGGAASAAAPAPAEPAAPMEPVAKAEGGYTIAEIYARKAELKGRSVKVRGRVVKVSRGIMAHNWIHLEDGSGAGDQGHLVFRSPTGLAEVGTVVTAEGTLDTDRDFGFSYQYPLLVEDATFSE